MMGLSKFDTRSNGVETIGNTLGYDAGLIHLGNNEVAQQFIEDNFNEKSGSVRLELLYDYYFSHPSLVTTKNLAKWIKSFAKENDFKLRNKEFKGTVFVILSELYSKLISKKEEKKIEIEGAMEELRKLSRYLTDNGELNDEYRTRIVTIRSKLRGKTLYKRELIEEQRMFVSEYTLDKSEDLSEVGQLKLETEKDRREFVTNKKGLQIIESRFGLYDRILIEAFFKKDEKGNDQVHKLVEIRNGLVYEDAGSDKVGVYKNVA